MYALNVTNRGVLMYTPLCNQLEVNFTGFSAINAPTVINNEGGFYAVYALDVINMGRVEA